MDVTMKYLILLLISLIVMSAVRGGIKEDMDALEEDLKSEHLKSTQKKSIIDLSTEELINELKRDMESDKNKVESKKSHRETFDSIISKTAASNDFDKILMTNDKVETSKPIHKRDDDLSLLRRAISTIAMLRNADASDKSAQKKALDLLNELTQADEKHSKRETSFDWRKQLKKSNDDKEKRETAEFIAALDADTKTMKEKAKKAVALMDLDKIEIKEVTENKNDKDSTNSDKILEEIAADILKEISHDKADETKHSKQTKKENKGSGNGEDQDCKDYRSDCASLKGYCKIYTKRLLKICPKTCGFCIPCEDKLKEKQKCKIVKKRNKCSNKIVEKYCQKTCGYCKAPAPLKCSAGKFGCCWDLSTTKQDKKGSNCPKCADKYAYICKNFKVDCRGNKLAGDFMRTNCPGTCGICSGNHKCEDAPKSAYLCPHWKKANWCTLLPQNMRYDCPKTCNFC